MSDNRLVTGVVIGVAITLAVCYILYLQDENERLKSENESKRREGEEKIKHTTQIINLSSVPRSIRKDFVEAVKHPESIAKITHRECLKRALALKNMIENRDGYRLFYKDNKPILSEKQIHFLYDLTWYETHLSVDKEVNNGRGPVDFKVSHGLDQTLVEFKLASNTHLRKNIQNQLEIYSKANNKPSKIMVIIFFTEKQQKRVENILNELVKGNRKNIVLIDARSDNKQSASVA